MPDETTAAILCIHAQTSLHPGCGTALGTVDLPVQRERHTQWPVIPGSAIKGILRDACRRRTNGKTAKDADEGDDIQAVFGPPAGKDASANAGAVSFTDARLLAYPVRSLKGVFAWVTCPAVLERLARDLTLIGAKPPWSGPIPAPAEGRALVAAGSPLLVDGAVVLEEFEFARQGDCDGLAKWVAGCLRADEPYRPTADRLRGSLVVIPDDDFTHFARHATEVVARIGLNYDTKTVKTGALFYQEFIPPEAIFYAVVIASASRRKDDGRDARKMLAFVADRLPAVVQIGGDETTGKGLCALRLRNGKEA